MPFIEQNVYSMNLNHQKHSCKQTSLKTFLIIILLSILGFSTNIKAQKIDSTGRAHELDIEKFGKSLPKYDTSLLKSHSPRKASFYSAVLPGLGQIYNKKYWKAPIIYAGAGTLVYFIIFNNTQRVRYKTAYLKRLANDPSDPDEFWKNGVQKYDAGQFKDAQDYFRRNRDLCILSLAAVYIANIVDATVDAYLFDYDVSQNLSLNIKPTLINSPESFNFGLSCSLRF